MEHIDKEVFLSPSIKKHYIIFVIRKALLKAVTDQLPFLKGTLVDIGCGIKPYREYILDNSEVTEYIGVEWKGLSYHLRVEPEKYWDGKVLPFSDESVESCMATEVFEHLSDPVAVGAEAYRILKPGGVLFLTVPFLWPLHEVPYDEYRYTPFSLKRILQDAGFDEENITIRATGGWYASLAQMITHVLGIHLSPKRWYRKWLIKFTLPLVVWLQKNDRPPVDFKNHAMPLGYSILAIKSPRISGETVIHAQNS
jgi:SAM-dependent methyltransferase